ncbi:MAG: glycosyltransferase [Gemmatimonadota bacterium]
MNQTQQTIRGLRDLEPITPRQEWLIRALAFASLAFGLYWLYWRWTQTLNPDHIIFSVALVTAETWGWNGSAIFLFKAWQVRDREPPPAPAGRSVDVFITTYDEPLEVVRRTAIGARAIRYPHRTYILDDGKRDEVLQLAQELGLGYIRRKGNPNAKAGNLNHAIAVTNGEFVLQLDADHVPLPNIIDRLLGYFTDPTVAFVQSPQDFYNTDSFTHVINEKSRSMWEENRIFYSLIQPGKDHWNATFFCGSCGMLRRAALEEVGGFSTETIIEDMETSIKLHARGWKSAYHTEALAFGLSPASASSFHVQRLRWAQGSMQMLQKLNPLFLPGLRPGQRACYFAANMYPLDGIQKAVFYLSPVIFLLTGAVPLQADTGPLLWRLGLYLTLSIGAFELVARGTGWLFIQERYNMAKFPTYILALPAFFAKGKLRFHVTPKGMTDAPFRTYAPQLALLIISVAALVWAPFAYYYGWIRYDVGSMDLAFLISGGWVAWNVYFAHSVVRLSLRARQQRSDHRFSDQFPVQIRASGAAGAQPEMALTRDLNPQGIAFRTTSRLEAGTALQVTLPLATRTVVARGEVVHVESVTTLHGEVHLHGVRFERLRVDDRDAIELHCTHHAVPMWRRRYRQSLGLVTRAAEVVRNARGSNRRLIELPARITLVAPDGTTLVETSGLLEELSRDGARILLDHSVDEGTLVEFEVPGTDLAGSGEVIFTRMLESPMSVRYAIGLRLDPAAARARTDAPPADTRAAAAVSIEVKELAS